MASWNKNPEWVELGSINPQQYTSVEGLLASAYNKVLENMQYLFNHLGAADIQVKATQTEFVQPGGSVTLHTPDGDKVVPYPGDVLVYIEEDQHTHGNHTAYLTWYFVLPQQKINADGESISTSYVPTESTVAPKASVTVTPSYNEDGSVNFKFTFDIQTKQGPPGPQGPAGPSAAAGMTIIPVVLTDWTASGTEKKLTIPASKHKMGATSNLLVFTHPEQAPGYEQYYDDVHIGDDGTVTITAYTAWAGKVLVAGGIAEAVDAEARRQIEQLSTTKFDKAKIVYDPEHGELMLDLT